MATRNNLFVDTSGTENHAGRRAVRIQLASGIGEASLGSRNSTTQINDLSLAVHDPRLLRHRAQIIYLVSAAMGADGTFPVCIA